MKIIQDKIKKILLKKFQYEVSDCFIEVTTPKREVHGDYTSNIAFKLSKRFHKEPIEIANEITKELKNDYIFEDVIVISPGFINFFISFSGLYSELNMENLVKIPLKFIDQENIKSFLKDFPKEKIVSMQYVHSRIYSILKIFKEEGIDLDEKINIGEYEFSHLQKDVLKNIILYDEMAQKDIETIISYAVELSEFFYKLEEETLFRKLENNTKYVILNIIDCIRKIINNILEGLSIEAPKKM